MRKHSLVTLGILSVGAFAIACSPSGSDIETRVKKPDAAGEFEDEFHDDAGADSPFIGDAACAAVTEEANETPLSLYIALDKSMSMEPRWNRAMAGLKAFLQDPQSAGIWVAINFFPKPLPQQECLSEGYVDPAVDFGLLPGHAAALIAAIDAETPDGRSTPVHPALGGAIRKAMTIAKQAKEEQRPASAAVLLVTDGEPEGNCERSHDAIAELARLGLQNDVRTFVVGLPGVHRDFANQVAKAGGTEQAIIIESNDVEGEFRKALAEVRGQALPCEFTIPEKVTTGAVAIDEVNVVYTKGGGGETMIIPQSPNCDGDGWRYDDPKNPTAIVLCPSTCTTLKADLSARIDIELGCATVIR